MQGFWRRFGPETRHSKTIVSPKSLISQTKESSPNQSIFFLSRNKSVWIDICLNCARSKATQYRSMTAWGKRNQEKRRSPTLASRWKCSWEQSQNRRSLLTKETRPINSQPEPSQSKLTQKRDSISRCRLSSSTWRPTTCKLTFMISATKKISLIS